MDFRNTVIIMTSNIGSPLILERSAELQDPATAEAVENAVLGELRQHFRPEFLNRVDDVIVFRPLDRDGAQDASWTCSCGGCEQLLADRS